MAYALPPHPPTYQRLASQPFHFQELLPLSSFVFLLLVSGEECCLDCCSSLQAVGTMLNLSHLPLALQIVARRLSAGCCFDQVPLWLHIFIGSSRGKIQTSLSGLPQSAISLPSPSCLVHQPSQTPLPFPSLHLELLSVRRPLSLEEQLQCQPLPVLCPASLHSEDFSASELPVPQRPGPPVLLRSAVCTLPVLELMSRACVLVTLGFPLSRVDICRV